jgi:DNA-binding HxlR family transcriptional regulator
MSKRYDQYCPVAHALDLVGERWALLVVRELMHGPKRYTDLAEHLPRIGTNILASRLRDLEACGIVAKRTLPPPAASRVYELTDYGRGLRPVMRELALWGARSLGPPTAEDELFPGWLENALDTVLAPIAPPGRFEFRIGGEVASLVDGEALPGPIENPDVVVEGDPEGLYHMFVDRRLDLVSARGDRGLSRWRRLRWASQFPRSHLSRVPSP